MNPLSTTPRLTARIRKRSGSYRALDVLFRLGCPCRLNRTCRDLYRLAGAGRITVSGDLQNIPRSHMLTFVCQRRLCSDSHADGRCRRCTLSLFHHDHESLPASPAWLSSYVCRLVLSLAYCVVHADTSLLSSVAFTGLGLLLTSTPLATVACPGPSAVTFIRRYVSASMRQGLRPQDALRATSIGSRRPPARRHGLRLKELGGLM